MSTFGWAILAAGIWGVVPLLEKWGLARSAPLVGLFYRCLGVILGFLLLLVFMLRPAQVKSVDLRSALLLMSGGFLASFVGQICFYNSLKAGEVSRIVTIAGSYPLITFVLGVIFLGESASLIKVAGVLLITLGVWALKIG